MLRTPVPPNACLEGMSLLEVLRGHEDSSVRRTLYWRFQRGANRLKAIYDGEFKLVIDNGNRVLIHLGRDPSEETNLIDSMPERAAALEAKLTAWEADVAPARLRDFRADRHGSREVHDLGAHAFEDMHSSNQARPLKGAGFLWRAVSCPFEGIDYTSDELARTRPCCPSESPPIEICRPRSRGRESVQP